MILVTAATGHLGTLVLERLAAEVDPSTIVATARRPERLQHWGDRGLHVRTLDYDRPETIPAALEGVDQVLLISGSEIGRRVPQHRAVIDAAAAAAVEHVAYTSILRADSWPNAVAAEHLATEQALAAAPVTSTVLRHGWYTENYTGQLDAPLANGAFIGTAGDGRVAAAPRADYAAADVAVLLDPSWRGGVYELAGEPFTLAELAAAVSARVGRSLPYADLATEQLTETLASAGLPGPLVEFLVGADVAIRQGVLDAPSSTLARLIGRAPTSLTDVLDGLGLGG